MTPYYPHPHKGFTPHPNAAQLREGALKLVQAIVDLDIADSLKRRMLSHCLWTLTETEGTSKYRTKHMSQAAIGRRPALLHHEHVIPRRMQIDAMLREPARAVEIAATAVGCTVTRLEHRLLTAQDRDRPELEGWDRYRAADIVVINTETGKTM